MESDRYARGRIPGTVAASILFSGFESLQLLLAHGDAVALESRLGVEFNHAHSTETGRLYQVNRSLPQRHKLDVGAPPSTARLFCGAGRSSSVTRRKLPANGGLADDRLAGRHRERQRTLGPPANPPSVSPPGVSMAFQQSAPRPSFRNRQALLRRPRGRYNSSDSPSARSGWTGVRTSPSG
jgi:hypothetical protein